MLERNILAKFQAHHNHTGYPEEDDVITGYKGSRRIEMLEFFRFFRPAHGFKRPETGAEPGVKYIFVLMNMLAVAVRTFRQVRTGYAGLAAVITVPGRNPVPPPKLTGNTPVADIFEPLQVNLAETLRHELNTAVFNCLHSRLS